MSGKELHPKGKEKGRRTENPKVRVLAKDEAKVKVKGMRTIQKIVMSGSPLGNTLYSQLSFQRSCESMEKGKAETKVKGREKVKVRMGVDAEREKVLAIRTMEETMILAMMTIATTPGMLTLIR